MSAEERADSEWIRENSSDKSPPKRGTSALWLVATELWEPMG